MADPVISVVRADDLVVQTYRFRHVTLEAPTVAGSSARLVCGGTSDDPPLVIVEFPPQSVFEQALAEDDELPPMGSLLAEYSGVSRLVFPLPPATTLDFTLEALLRAWRGRPLRVEPAPDPDRDDDPFVVNPLDSLVEIPAGLLLHLEPGATFEHEANPAKRATPAALRTELWHSRLSQGRLARAVWARRHLLSILSFDERKAIIENTRTGPLTLDRLMVSSLGAWFESRGEWEGAEVVSTWRHRSTMGRDQFVQVGKPGFLFPFGHRATLVTVTERKLSRGLAVLRQREFIVVRQREMSYGTYRGLPFRSVQLTVRTTPDLVPAAQSRVLDGQGVTASWVRVKNPAGGSVDLEFDLVATDHGGRTVEFSRPLAFVPRSEVTNNTLKAWMTGTDRQEFHAAGQQSRRARAMGMQRIAYAAGTGAGSSPDPSLETDSLDIGAVTDGTLLASVGTEVVEDRSFLPRLLTASARVPVIRDLTGADLPVNFSYDETFVLSGQAPLDVFARLAPDTGNIQFRSTEQAGGLVTPNFRPTALSREHGLVGGSDKDLAQGAFSPSEYFPSDIKILGGPSLADVLAAGAVGGTIGIPQLVSTDTPTETTTNLHWTTALTESDKDGILFDGSGGTLELDVSRVTPRNGSAATARVTGSLRNFQVSIPAAHPLIDIPFDTLTFTAEAGKKVDVGVRIGKIEFQNELRFVNALSAIFPPEGFDDPPALDVTADGVRVGYSLAVPTVPMGALLVQNLALGAFFNLPFVGTASLTFALSTRDDPFIVTYSAIGGGGFVALELGVDGGIGLEASFEFGGAFALDIGVASGGVSVMAGIYYGMRPPELAFAAFIRMAGAMEILGIVAISVEFYLELGYVDPGDGGRLEGTARLTVKVKIAFFSKKVALKVSRTLAKGGDPSFADAVTRAHWAAYCDAFGKD